MTRNVNKLLVSKATQLQAAVNHNDETITQLIAGFRLESGDATCSASTIKIPIRLFIIFTNQ